MNYTQFQSWLEAYGRAWKTRDPNAVASLFTDDATYHENPFSQPMRGRAAIREYWTRATGNHSNVRFGYEILVVTEDLGVAKWYAEFLRTPPGIHVQLDGVFVISLDANCRCASLREWWHRLDKEPKES